jgi:hypothetical protein
LRDDGGEAVMLVLVNLLLLVNLSTSSFSTFGSVTVTENFLTGPAHPAAVNSPLIIKTPSTEAL